MADGFNNPERPLRCDGALPVILSSLFCQAITSRWILADLEMFGTRFIDFERKTFKRLLRTDATTWNSDLDLHPSPARP
jgi:hypothetical protein